jgi:hypothetical protein
VADNVRFPDLSFERLGGLHTEDLSALLEKKFGDNFIDLGRFEDSNEDEELGRFEDSSNVNNNNSLSKDQVVQPGSTPLLSKFFGFGKQ